MNELELIANMLIDIALIVVIYKIGMYIAKKLIKYGIDYYFEKKQEEER